MEFREPIVAEIKGNFEGNDTLLFYDRLKNPKIKKQLVDLIFEHENDRSPMVPDYVDEFGNVIKAEPNPPAPKTREQIEQELDQNIEKVFSVTAIDQNPKGTSDSGAIEINGEWIPSGTVALFSKHFETGEPWTPKQLSIIEAHEKGHGVRLLHMGENLASKIRSGLDFSKIKIDDRMISIWREVGKARAEMSNDNVREEILDYFSQPHEIMERMAQLKNYFGMKGDERFTKRHLDYAKQHYLEDTGMGIQMAPFLEAITPETQDNFLLLINSLGI